MAMLQKLADHIAAAKAMASEAEQHALQASDEPTRTEQLELAKAWRHVASSYEFVLTLERFVIDAHRNHWPIIAEELPKMPAPDEKH
jgi:hypothetical protein